MGERMIVFVKHRVGLADGQQNRSVQGDDGKAWEDLWEDHADMSMLRRGKATRLLHSSHVFVRGHTNDHLIVASR